MSDSQSYEFRGYTFEISEVYKWNDAYTEGHCPICNEGFETTITLGKSEFGFLGTRVKIINHLKSKHNDQLASENGSGVDGQKVLSLSKYQNGLNKFWDI